ncbi:hypothetical protein H0H93_002846, partial [Arthromyces matolae]
MIPFAGLILIDPPIFHPSMWGKETEMYKLVLEMTPSRKDIWSSKAEAIKWMSKRPPFSSWDKRVFDVYAVRKTAFMTIFAMGYYNRIVQEHGLQPLPTA